MKSLFPIVEKYRYGFIDARGRVVIEPRFRQALEFSEGFAAAIEDKKWGFIDDRGRWAIEPSFRGASSFRFGVARVQVGRKWVGSGLIDQTGAFVLEPKYEQLDHVSRNKRVAAQCAETAKHGLLTWNGNWIAEPGKLVLLGKFVRGLAPARKTPGARKDGYVNAAGKWVIEPRYAEAHAFREGLALVFTRWNGGQIYIDKSGDEVHRTKYKTTGHTSENGFHEGLARGQASSGWGFINKRGAIAIPFEHEFVWRFSEGLAAAGGPGGRGYINKKGKWVVRPVLYSAMPFRSGLARVFAERGRPYGYIDKTGRWIWQPKKPFGKRFQDLSPI